MSRKKRRAGDAEKICLLCGRIFIPKEKAQRYCCKGCAKEAARERERERRQGGCIRRHRLSDNMHAIARLNEQARAVGLHYGAYVARYGCGLRDEYDG